MNLSTSAPYLKELRNRCLVIRKVSFRPFRNALTTPTYEDIFGKRGIRILDFDERELNLAIGEVFHKIHELPLC